MHRVKEFDKENQTKELCFVDFVKKKRKKKKKKKHRRRRLDTVRRVI